MDWDHQPRDLKLGVLTTKLPGCFYHIKTNPSFLSVYFVKIIITKNMYKCWQRLCFWKNTMGEISILFTFAITFYSQKMTFSIKLNHYLSVKGVSSPYTYMNNESYLIQTLFLRGLLTHGQFSFSFYERQLFLLSICLTIMKTCLFKYTENFTTKKRQIFRWKTPIFFIYLLKTLIVGTCLNCLSEAVLMCTHNLCF